MKKPIKVRVVRKSTSEAAKTRLGQQHPNAKTPASVPPYIHIALVKGNDGFCKCKQRTRGPINVEDAEGLGYWETCDVCGKMLKDGYHKYDISGKFFIF